MKRLEINVKLPEESSDIDVLAVNIKMGHHASSLNSSSSKGSMEHFFFFIFVHVDLHDLNHTESFDSSQICAEKEETENLNETLRSTSITKKCSLIEMGKFVETQLCEEEVIQ